MTKRLFFLIISSVMLFSTCKKEIEALPPPLPPCPERVYQYLNPMTEIFVKRMWTKKNIIFRDSLQNELVFTNNTAGHYVVYSDIYNCSVPCIGGKCVTHYMFPTAYLKNIKDSTQSLTFECSFNATPDSHPLLGVETVMLLGKNIFFANIPLNKLGGASSYSTQDAETITLFNKTYANVYVDKLSAKPKLYIDTLVGLRAFRDIQQRLWVFNRLE
jgi:hypothetical protein